MTLTEEDVERISKLGVKDFYMYKGGYLQLVNVQGRCIFLKRDKCSIYEDRPAGCRLYPLILDLDNDDIILHDFCPYTEEFNFTDEDEDKLQDVIDCEEKERDERILKRLHEVSG
jgi:Fe-S-cluster containining protein